MGKLRLRIADIVISIVSDERVWEFPLDSVYRRFIADGTDSRGDASIRVHWGNAPICDLGEKVFVAWHSHFADPILQLYRKDGQRIVRTSTPYLEIRSHRLGVFEADFRSGDVYITFPQESPDIYPYPLEFPLDRILLLNMLALGRGTMMHACGINDGGRGFVFIGPSGSGKTTLARLWKGHQHVTVLGDECLVIRRIENQYRVYGTPWTGREKFASPEGIPLEKVFFIRHADKNVISPKKEINVVENLLAQSFSSYDRAAMQYTLDFCSELSQRIPSYDLGFVPTEEVVDFVQGVK